MKLLLDFPMIGEPHYAQAIDAKLIQDKQVKFFKLAENQHPYVTKSEAETKVTRSGKTVHVHDRDSAPDNIEGVQVGDTVLFHVTEPSSRTGSFRTALRTIGSSNDAERPIMPGETRTLTWVARVPGVAGSTARTSAPRCTRRCARQVAARRRSSGPLGRNRPEATGSESRRLLAPTASGLWPRSSSVNHFRVSNVMSLPHPVRHCKPRSRPGLRVAAACTSRRRSTRKAWAC